MACRAHVVLICTAHRGFRSSFDRGVLMLYFNFVRPLSTVQPCVLRLTRAPLAPSNAPSTASRPARKAYAVGRLSSSHVFPFHYDVSSHEVCETWLPCSFRLDPRGSLLALGICSRSESCLFGRAGARRLISRASRERERRRTTMSDSDSSSDDDFPSLEELLNSRCLVAVASQPEPLVASAGPRLGTAGQHTNVPSQQSSSVAFEPSSLFSSDTSSK